MRTHQCFFALLCALLLGSGIQAATVIDDFSGGVSAANHPEGAGTFNVWYDITNDAFATASAGTLEGSDALLIEDGGFTNGVYAIYESVIPADGIYTVSADMLVNDTATSGMANYQIGAVVNGEHRGVNPSDLDVVTGPGTGVGNYTGLNPEELDDTSVQTVTTSSFNASAGDNLLIAFGTSVDMPGFESDSSFWNDASVLVDNVMLQVIPEPTTLGLLASSCCGLFAFRRRRLG